MTSAIVTSSILLNFTHIQHGILHIKIYTTKKTGRYVKDESFSFQKMKTKQIKICTAIASFFDQK